MNELKQGYNLVGLSQGNVVARGLIELCDGAPPVKNFISIGGPNAGVAFAPACTGHPWCGQAGAVSGVGIYSDYVQGHYAPSGYTKLPNNIAGYLKGCRVLPKINNEIPNATNPIYKQRFASLQNLVLIMTNLYLKDLFGLQTLDKAGKIKFIKVPGLHLAMDIIGLQQHVVPYLIDEGAPKNKTA
ncbi:putative ATPase 7, plasma membrane-type isoform 1 [Capsicum annuum]|nr:putative ATPase 7, plasma membrane-type isoform 1 [Capsicum annuum]